MKQDKFKGVSGGSGDTLWNERWLNTKDILIDPPKHQNMSLTCDISNFKITPNIKEMKMENPSKTQKHAVRVLTESGRVVCVKSGKTNGSVKRRVCHSSASIENFFNGPVNQTKSPSAFDLEKRRHLKLIIWERPCKNPACGNDAWPDGDGHCQKCHHDIVTARKKVKSKMAKIKDEITKVLLGQEQHIDITM